MYPADDDIDFEAIADEAAFAGVLGGSSSTAPVPGQQRPGMALGYPPAFPPQAPPPGFEQEPQDFDFEALVDQEMTPGLSGQEALQAMAMGAIPNSVREANEARGTFGPGGTFFDVESGYMPSPGLSQDIPQTLAAGGVNLAYGGVVSPAVRLAGLLGGNIAEVLGVEGGGELAKEQLEAGFREGGDALRMTAEVPAALTNDMIARVPGGLQALQAIGADPYQMQEMVEADPLGTAAMAIPGAQLTAGAARGLARGKFTLRGKGSRASKTEPASGVAGSEAAPTPSAPTPTPDGVPAPRNIQEALDLHRNAQARADRLPPQERRAARIAADEELRGHIRRLSEQDARPEAFEWDEEPPPAPAGDDGVDAIDRALDADRRARPPLPREGEDAPAPAAPVDEGLERGRKAIQDFKDKIRERRQRPATAPQPEVAPTTPAAEVAPQPPAQARRPAPPDLYKIAGSDDAIGGPLYNTRTDLTDVGGTVKHNSRGGSQDITIGRRTLEELGYEVPDQVPERAQARQDVTPTRPPEPKRGDPARARELLDQMRATIESQQREPTQAERMMMRTLERQLRDAPPAEKPLPQFKEPEGPVREVVVKKKRKQPMPDLGDPSVEGAQLDPYKVAMHIARTDGLKDTAEHRHVAGNYVGPKGKPLPGLVRKKGGLSRDEWAERLAGTGWFGPTDDYQAARNAAHDWLEGEFYSPKPQDHYRRSTIEQQAEAHDTAQRAATEDRVARRIDAMGLKTTPDEVMGKPTETLNEMDMLPGDTLYLPDEGDIFKVRQEDGQTVLQDGKKIELPFGAEVDAARLVRGEEPAAPPARPPSRGVRPERGATPVKRRDIRMEPEGDWRAVKGARYATAEEAQARINALAQAHPELMFRSYATAKGDFEVRGQRRPTMDQARRAIDESRKAREEAEAAEAEFEEQRAAAEATGQTDLFDAEATARAEKGKADRDAVDEFEGAQEDLFEGEKPEVAERRWAVVNLDDKPVSELLTQKEAVDLMADLREQGERVQVKEVVKRKKAARPSTGSLLGTPALGTPAPETKQGAAPAPSAAKTDPGVRTAHRSRAEKLKDLVRTPEAVARRAEIAESLESISESPIRQGRVRRKELPGAEGWFDTFRRMIRVKDKKSVAGPGGRPGSSVVPHEVGHALQKLLFPDLRQPGFDYKGKGAQQIRAELGALGKALYGNRKPTGGYKSEGFAEFVRLWITDRDLAKQKAPRFWTEFQDRLALDKFTIRAAEIMDQAHADVQRYRKQPAVAKILSNLSIGQKRKRRWNLGNLYAAFVDKDTFVGDSVKAMFGGKMPEHGTGNAWTAVQLYRGTSGIADLVIRSGIPDIRRNRLLEQLGQIGMDNPEVRAGTKPIMEVPTAASDVVDKVRAHKLSELGPLVEVRRTKQGGPQEVYVSDLGRKYLEERGDLRKMLPGLQEILGTVSDAPLPYTAHAQGTNALSRFMERVQGHEQASRGLDGFRVYGVAKRTLELVRRERDRADTARAKGEKYRAKDAHDLTGIRLQDAEAAIRELDEAYPQMAEAWEKFQKWNRGLINLLVDEGMLTAREAQHILRYDYFPLRRVLDTLDQVGPSGRKLVNVGKPVRRLKGSTADIIDPLESSIHNAFQIVHAIMRNRVGRELLDMADVNPGSGWLIEPLPKDKVPTNFKLSEVKEDIQRMLKRDLGSAYDPDLMDLVDFEVSARVWRPKMFAPEGEGIVGVWRDGKQEWVQLDPELHRTLAGLDREQAKLMMKLVGAPASWLRAGATLHPDFAVKNILRDAITAGLFGKADFLHSIPGAHQASGLKSRGVQFMRDVQGKTLDMAKGPLEDDWYFRWKASGASSANLVSLDREYLQKGLRDVLRNRSFLRRAGARLAHPLEALQDISDVAENATRIGIFKEAAQRHGMDKTGLLRAGIESRDTTLDFSRRGRIIENYGRMTAFLNANIQGVDKFGRVIFTEAMKDPKRARQFAARVSTFVVAPSVVAWALTRNDPEYEGLPDYQKDLFWNLPKGDGSFVRIPKPFDVGVIYGTGTERALRWVDSQDPHALDGFAATVVDNMVPTVIPTFLAPLWENASNTRLYGGRPVEPRREQDLEPAFRFGQFTSETAKAGAAAWRGLGELPGVGPMAGAIPLQSPRQVDNLIRGWTGGLGSYYATPLLTDPIVTKIARATGSGELLGIGERRQLEKRLSEYPLLRSFNTQPEDAGAGTVDRFYEKVDASEKAWRSWMGMSLDKGGIYLESPEKRDLIVTYHAIQRTARKLQALQASRREALSKGNRAAALEWWKKIVDQVKQGEKDIAAARQDPTGLDAARYDRAVRDLRVESDGRRAGYSNAISNHIDGMADLNDPDSWRSLSKWVTENVPREDHEWAKDFARGYAMQKARNAKEEAEARAPKKFRLKIAR